MSEIDLLRHLQIEASNKGHRLFRNNEGVGWAGTQVRVSHPQMIWMNPGDVLVKSARALHAGLGTGSSDLIGISKDGRFLAVEVKAPKGRTTEGQESFIEMVRRMNGIGIIARSLEDLKI